MSYSLAAFSKNVPVPKSRIPRQYIPEQALGIFFTPWPVTSFVAYFQGTRLPEARPILLQSNRDIQNTHVLSRLFHCYASFIRLERFKAFMVILLQVASRKKGTDHAVILCLGQPSYPGPNFGTFASMGIDLRR